jgi:hypothetical protein
MMRRLGWSLGLGLCACGGGGGGGESGSDTYDGSWGPPTTAGDATNGGTTGDGSGPGGSLTGDGSDTDEPGTGPSTGPGTGPGDSSESGGMPPPMTLPPVNAGLDYQLGGAYPPPDGVEVVSRDRNDPPADGLYNICYVNGYQTQPDEEDWWLTEHPDLILRDDNGDPVIDPDWDEMLLDIRTPEQREALAEIVGGWITTCGADGYDAVEIDNLDTYSRSQGLLTQDQAVAYMSLLSEAAHASGLAIAQKNSTEIVERRDEMGTDFAVAEECNRWDECQDYIAGYGDAVLVIEYRPVDFDAGCAAYPELSIVLRDLDLVPAGSGGYVFDGC